ncbi:MAG: FG-GAP repeat protein, partial [Candidatus Omnitrophica bacterium]|nr:FG-GAP repeat protein [Candidatus Omnitrophota bacterium]
LIPDVTVTQSLQFGERSINSGFSDALAVEILNLGPDYLDFRPPHYVVTGDDAGDFEVIDYQGPRLTPEGQSFEFLVSFNPKTVGIKSATLLLFTNHQMLPLEIPLSGEGIWGAPYTSGLSIPDSNISVTTPPIIEGVLDVNGNGSGDLVVAIPNKRVEIVDGLTMEVLLTLHPPVSEETGFASSIAVIDDTNGNDRFEIAVGSPSEGIEDFIESGAVHIFDSATGELIGSLTSPYLQSLERFGSHLTAAGDINDNGHQELVVGAGYPEYDRSNPFVYYQNPKSYVFDTGSGNYLRSLFDFNTTKSDLSGPEVSPIADINNDGIPDIAVGSGISAYFGHIVHLLSGATGQVIRKIQPPNGFTNSPKFGMSISGVPDVTGDGVQDLVVGSKEDYVGLRRGRPGVVYVYNGVTGDLFLTISDSYAQKNFGGQVKGIEDIDGDGFGDVLIGSPEGDDKV